MKPRTPTADDRATQIADWLARHKDDLLPPPVWVGHMIWLLDNRRFELGRLAARKRRRKRKAKR